ncbi:MAG TPA: glycosyltransferase [Thermoanaerobaculia bacterium]|nr:glycosyltransferase [Thermoanaerobaculia bacterium]
MRFLKFDRVHPREFLLQTWKGWKDLKTLDAAAYRDRIISLRSNYSDFFTHHLRRLGWNAEEFFPADEVFCRKIARELRPGGEDLFWRLTSVLPRKAWLRSPKRFEAIRRYVVGARPDILFVREWSEVPSSFWRSFRDQCLLVGRLSAPRPPGWQPADWDLLYTNGTGSHRSFREQGVPTLEALNGFDRRILEETVDRGRRIAVAFVGGLGAWFEGRTRLMRSLAEHGLLEWWGYGLQELDRRDPLRRVYRGLASGLAMYQIYRDSRIVVNDYIGVAGGLAVNQRLFEVLGVGSLLLTREDDSLAERIPRDCFVSYRDEEDCLAKARKYLADDAGRERIAARGQAWVLERAEYALLMRLLARQLEEAYERRFGRGPGDASI